MAQSGLAEHATRCDRAIIGTPEQIATSIEDGFRGGACDGFNLMPDVLPSGLEAFVEHVVPILRRRGIFGETYKGETLRDHRGLARAAWTPPAEPEAVSAA